MSAYPAETLLLEGVDAIAFAQAQLSSRIDDIPNGQWRFSAWLDAKGRVIALFHVARLADDRLLLLLRGGRAQDIAASLQRFVFRSKVKIVAQSARALSRGANLPMHAVESDDTRVVFGCDTHSLVVGETNNDGWHLPQLHMGWPWLPDDALGELLPPMISLHHLHAVAIDKGCYPGQEIVARLHYRGGNKRHMHSVVLSRQVVAGSVWRDGEREVLRVLDVVEHDGAFEALAVIADDAIEGLNDNTLALDDATFTVSLRERWPN